MKKNMSYYLLFNLLTLLLLIGCGGTSVMEGNNNGKKTVKADEPMTGNHLTMTEKATIPIVDFAGLQPIFQKQNDTTYLINFWATWCKPCVEELPYFMKLQKAFSNEKFKMIFVSMDFPKQIEKKLVPFLVANSLPGQVIVLDDPDSNTWIPKVNPEWSGSIPATYVYQGQRNIFAEKSFHDYLELKEWVETLK